MWSAGDHPLTQATLSLFCVARFSQTPKYMQRPRARMESGIVVPSRPSYTIMSFLPRVSRQHIQYIVHGRPMVLRQTTPHNQGNNLLYYRLPHDRSFSKKQKTAIVHVLTLIRSMLLNIVDAYETYPLISLRHWRRPSGRIPPRFPRFCHLPVSVRHVGCVVANS